MVIDLLGVVGLLTYLKDKISPDPASKEPASREEIDALLPRIEQYVLTHDRNPDAESGRFGGMNYSYGKYALSHDGLRVQVTKQGNYSPLEGRLAFVVVSVSRRRNVLCSRRRWLSRKGGPDPAPEPSKGSLTKKQLRSLTELLES